MFEFKLPDLGEGIHEGELLKWYVKEGDKIGEYLLAISDDALKKYEKENQSISFFTQFSDDDIEQVVKSPSG